MNYPDTALVITHYNRPNSLLRLLKSFQDLKMDFGEIVVSDDASNTANLEKVKKICGHFNCKLIESKENGGLGRNLNQGMASASLPYILYVQEDFVPCDLFREKYPQAIKAIKEDASLDIIRFYAYFKYPLLKEYAGKFKLMRFNLLKKGYRKFYAYSDHPHLRRKSFSEKFGHYTEGVKPDRTEYNMMISFLKKGGKGLFYEDYKSLFHQINTDVEPSQIKRNYWRNSKLMPITVMRNIYRHLRMNFDYLRP